MEEDNITLVIHVLTHSRASPCRNKDVSIVTLVVVLHNCTNSLSCTPTMIKRDAGAVVVCNMSLSILLFSYFVLYLENVMEDVFTYETEIAVHGCCGTALKIPCFPSIMRECRVSVLQIRYQDQPVIDPEIWHEIIMKNS